MALDKPAKESAIKDFKLNDQDTGSTQVQIALLSKRISDLTKHCQVNRQDFSSRRGLLKMVAQRRSLLKYLASNDEVAHREIKQKLGLR